MAEQRTNQQSRALHLYFDLLAADLNAAGLDHKAVLPRVADVPWSGATIKALIWHPIQEAQLGRRSTTELTTAEVSQVYETVNRLVASMGVHTAFPCIEMQTLQEESQ